MVSQAGVSHDVPPVLRSKVALGTRLQLDDRRLVISQLIHSGRHERVPYSLAERPPVFNRGELLGLAS